MPRSNKKKGTQNSQNAHLIPGHSTKKTNGKQPPETFTASSNAIALLFRREKKTMLDRAIESGRKHGIKLKIGSPNPGTGDCAFEAIIQNNNDRQSFADKYNMPVNHYRKIWTTDMANRTINSEWNIYSHQEWRERWADMAIPGTYERGFFGDLMLPGIACGIKKFLLIFNTNLDTPHDPIYVVDPRKFNVEPDIEIPIVLAYNLSHYESLHPCEEADIQETVNLVNKYLTGRYQFTKSDLPYLLTIESTRTITNLGQTQTKVMVEKQEHVETIRRRGKKHCQGNTTSQVKSNRDKSTQNSQQEINLDEVDEYLDTLENDDNVKEAAPSMSRRREYSTIQLKYKFKNDQHGSKLKLKSIPNF